MSLRSSMDQNSKASVLLLAVLAVVLWLQVVAVRGEVAVNNTGAAVELEVLDSFPPGGQDLGPFSLVGIEGDTEPVVDDADDDHHELDTAEFFRPRSRFLINAAPKTCKKNNDCKNEFAKAGCCKKICLNLIADVLNCGKCGKKCKKGSLCVQGTCKKPTPPPCKKPCKTGSFCCGTQCKKILTDEKNCGMCGLICGLGKTCCNGQCVDLKTNCANCGKCGKRCAFGQTCCNGKCKYLQSNDKKNCGMCGLICGQGKSCCNGQCVDLKTNGANCGNCGKRCAFGQTCCTGKCRCLQSNDKENCGACGNKCPKGVKCLFGMCGYAS